MTKAKTEAQKRRERKSRMPELAAPAKRKARGRKRMTQIQVENDADTPALVARCRQLGQNADEAGLRAAKAEWMGCNAGRAMASVTSNEAERTELWAAIHHMRRVQLAYDRAIGSPNRHPQCLRIMLPVDEMHADAASPPLDVRTDDERHRQAVTGWMQLQGWLGYADKDAAGLCKRVVIDDERCQSPAAMVKALHCVADGVSGRRIVYRGA